MAAIEEEVFVSKLNTSFWYTFSNDLGDILNAIYKRIGLRLESAADSTWELIPHFAPEISEWELNPCLAPEPKNIMNKYNVVYSTNSRIDKTGLEHTVINRKVGAQFFVYAFARLNGRILTEAQELQYYDALAGKLQRVIHNRHLTDEEVVKIAVELLYGNHNISQNSGFCCITHAERRLGFTSFFTVIMQRGTCK